MEDAAGGERMTRLVLLVLVGVLLGGCSRTIGWRDYAGDVATAAANGFATGGPVGGLVGLVTGLVTGAFTNRRKQNQVDRRDRLVEAYRRRFGDLAVEDYEQVTGKRHRLHSFNPNKEPRHAHP